MCKVDAIKKRGNTAICLALICVITLSFSGCKSKTLNPKTPLSGHTGNYTTSAKISYKELKATAHISQETPSRCSVTFESPPSLAEMAFVFQEDSVDLNYKGLSFQFEPDSVPGNAVAKLAVTAINKAMRDDGLFVKLDDGTLEVNGVMESGEFVLKVHGKTGSLMKLSIPAEELEIEFDNFAFLD